MLTARFCAAHTKDGRVRAEAAFFKGRIAHAKGDINEAHQHYVEAVRLWEDFPLANFGLGQVLISRRELSKAIPCFERVLKKVPDTFEALKVLGSLYRETNMPDLAEHSLAKALALRPGDFEVCLELAIVRERRDPAKSVINYNQALSLAHDHGAGTTVAVTSELWNNVGVIRQRTGDYLGARDAFVRSLIAVSRLESGLQNSVNPIEAAYRRPSSSYLNDLQFLELWQPGLLKSDSFLLKPASVSVAFNLAVLFEEQTEFNSAGELFKRIVTAHPHYVDCWLRLSGIAVAQGQYTVAADYCKEVVAVSNQHLGAWTTLANIHMEKHEYDAAQKIFDNVLQTHKQDPYALVQYANLFLQAAQSNPDKKDRYLDKAEEWFSAVLKKDPHNVFAVNGLGVVLARRGLLNDARYAFSMLEDTFASHGQLLAQFGELPVDVLTNAANIHFEQRAFHQAAILYEKVLERASPQLAADLILPLLARSYYEDGKFDAARGIAARACHATPWKMDNWFNFALSMKDGAAKLINATNTTSDSLRNHALPLLEAAGPLFGFLEKPTSDKRVRYNVKKSGTLLRLCNGQIDTLETKIRSLEEGEAKGVLLREEKQKKFAERAEAERLAEESRRRIEDERNAELARRLQEQEELRLSIRSRYEEEHQRQLEAEAAKARQVDDIIAADDDDAVGSRKRKGRKPAKKPKKRKGANSGEEESDAEANGTEPAIPDDLDTADADVEAEADPLARLRRGREKQRLRRAADEEAEVEGKSDEDAEPAASANNPDIESLFQGGDEAGSGSPDSKKRKRAGGPEPAASEDAPAEDEAVASPTSPSKRRKTDSVTEAGDDVFPAEMTAEADAMLAD